MPKRFLDLEPIARGSEHIVCTSHQFPESVIKVPNSWWQNADAQDVKSDIAILREENVPTLATEVVSNAVVEIRDRIMNVPYVLIQEYSELPTLNTNHMKVSDVLEQISELLQKSVLINGKHGKGIDFLGAEAVKSLVKYFRYTDYPLHVHNFRIDNSDQIILSDTGMLSPNKCISLVSWSIQQIIDLQYYLIEGVIKTLDSGFKLDQFDPNLLVRATGGTMLCATSLWSGIKK